MIALPETPKLRGMLRTEQKLGPPNHIQNRNTFHG
jgi:hypothetical protein